MNYFILKIFLTAAVIAGVSELAKRSTAFAAVLAALPLTSILAMVWLYHDTHDPGKIASLSHGIFWAVLPSLLFFLILPLFLKSGVKFGLAMMLSSGIMAGAYLLYVWLLKRWGINW